MPTLSPQPVALVTGAGSGIGAATAQALARQGYLVVLAARRAETLEQVAAEIRAAGGVALPIVSDMRDPGQIERLARQTLEQAGRIDVLVNNAGISSLHKTWTVSDEQISEVLETNLIGPIRLTRAVLPTMMEQQRGHIINICSVAGHVALPGNSLYGVSKHGLRAWNDSLRHEVRHRGIAVSLVSPGYIRTPLTRRVRGVPMPGPEAVAKVIVKLLRHPRREVVVPRVYRLGIWSVQLMPWLADALLGRMRRR